MGEARARLEANLKEPMGGRGAQANRAASQARTEGRAVGCREDAASRAAVGPGFGGRVK